MLKVDNNEDESVIRNVFKYLENSIKDYQNEFSKMEAEIEIFKNIVKKKTVTEDPASAKEALLEYGNKSIEYRKKFNLNKYQSRMKHITDRICHTPVSPVFDRVVIGGGIAATMV